MTLKAILEEASKLSIRERGELIDELLCMGDKDDISLTPEQAVDLDRRINEYERGEADMKDGAQFLAELERKYPKAK